MGLPLKDLVSAQELPWDALAGRTLAVDGYNAVYQFLATLRQRDGQLFSDPEGRVTSHLMGVFYRTTSLLREGVLPVWVFDGKPPERKIGTIRQRIVAKEKAEEQWQEALAAGDLETARRRAAQTSRLTRPMVEELRQLLQALGVPFVQAPGEGEAQAAVMAARGTVWATGSEDYDSLLFGSPRLVRGLAARGRGGATPGAQLIDRSELLSSLGISDEELILLGIVMGTDFNDGVRGYGPKKSLKLVQEHLGFRATVEKVGRPHRGGGGGRDLSPSPLGRRDGSDLRAGGRDGRPDDPHRRTRLLGGAGPGGDRAGAPTSSGQLDAPGGPRPSDAARDLRGFCQSMTLFECVPNFSEGRDAERIERIVAPARDVASVTVLDVERNADHNRCVVSLVGEGDALVEAAFRMIRVAAELIDLNVQRGEHPRMGATDVVPFVPLGASTMPDAVRLAEKLGARVAKELGIPVYLYAAAAKRPERADLAVVREGQFEGLREVIATDPSRAPDFGEPKLHPTAGAIAIGARPVLIAYNAYLTTPDVTVAKRVAKAVRSRDGGLPEVKALGFEIRERNRAQVSMNLTDYRVTPVHRALEAVRREAARFGVAVEESEIVGLVPEDALFDAAEYYLQLHSFDRAAVLERKVRSVESAGPGHESIASFASRLAARTPTPGGGAAAGVVAALASALGEMVLAYSIDPAKPADDLVAVDTALKEGRHRFLELADEDALSYDAVRQSKRARKERPTDPTTQEAYLRAVRGAAEVPLETARRAVELANRLDSVRTRTRAALASDLVTSLALFRAATEGALANVAINLEDLKAAGQSIDALEAEVARLRPAH